MIPHSENIISKSLPAIYSRSIVQSFQVISHDRKLERTANEYKAFPLIIEYNPLLVDLNSVIKRNLPLLYCDNDMNNIFPEGTVKAQYRRGKNLKEILSPSGFPGNKIQRFSSLTKCNGKCDICKNFQ